MRLLGSFDKTLTMFREGRKVELAVDAFAPHELTFIYPDHAHLLSFYGSDVPPLFYKLPEDHHRQKFWGRLFTFQELQDEYVALGIDQMIRAHEEKDGWAGCYIEARLWCSDQRTRHSPSG